MEEKNIVVTLLRLLESEKLVRLAFRQGSHGGYFRSFFSQTVGIKHFSPQAAQFSIFS